MAVLSLKSMTENWRAEKYLWLELKQPSTVELFSAVEFIPILAKAVLDE